MNGEDTKHVLRHAIRDGYSLHGKTAEDLRSELTAVSAVGSLDNFSKWPLNFQQHEVESGQLLLLLRTVEPGKREAFSSRKTIKSTSGSQVHFTFEIDDDIHCSYRISARSITRYAVH